MNSNTSSSNSNNNLHLYDLAKYPFVDEAAGVMRRLGYTVEDFESREFAGVVKAAESRVRRHVGGTFDTALGITEDEVLTFLAACIIVHLTGIRQVTHKFALQEARRAEHFLIAELQHGERDARAGLLAELYALVAGRAIEPDPASPYTWFYMKVPDYLSVAAGCPIDRFRLINRPVTGGRVYMQPYDAVRLARDALMRLIRRRIEEMPVDAPNAPGPLVAAMRSIRAYYTDIIAEGGRPMRTIDRVEDMPPCVRHCIKYMADGNNLSDAGRFFLASYMIAHGRSADEVIDLYRDAPDFSEKVTRGHVEHIMHGKRDRQKYSVTGCERLALAGLCFRDASCGSILNPMQYSRREEEWTHGEEDY